VPNSAIISGGWTAVRLIDCIDRMPAGAGRARSAGITNAENVKNTPPTTPLPTAAITVVVCTRLLMRFSVACGAT